MTAGIKSSLLITPDGKIVRRAGNAAYIGGEQIGRNARKKLKSKMAAAVEAYCVKCKAKRNMKEANQVTMANGRKAMKGKCPECGTGMFKILGK